MEAKIGSVLGSGFAYGMDSTAEVEVSFRPTLERFNHMLKLMKSRNIPVSRQLTLDVSYTAPPSKNIYSSYRVSVVGEAQIQKALKLALTNKDKQSSSLAVFKRLVRDAASHGYTLIEKKRDKLNSAELNDDGLLLRIATETKLDDASIAKLEALPHRAEKSIFFRLKDRYTQVTMSPDKYRTGFVIKVDATVVTSGRQPSEIVEVLQRSSKVDANTSTYEVEVELTHAGGEVGVFNPIPQTVVVTFSKEIEYIQDHLLRMSLPRSSRSSRSSRSNRSNRSSVSSPESQSLSRESEDGLANDGTVAPRKWMLSNRTGFFDWMYTTFNSDRYAQSKPVGVGEVSLFPHQKIVRDFMQFNSPYRGLLLYHGLGVGKTMASIAAAEGFVRNSKKVIIMIPASLETNYRDEIIKSTSHGNPTQKLWDQVKVHTGTGAALLLEHIHMQPSFVNDKANVSNDGFAYLWIPTTLVDSIPVSALQNPEAGVDAAGGGALERVPRKVGMSWSKLSEKEKELAQQTLSHLLDTKYTFIRYNGVTQAQLKKYGDDLFEDAFIVIDEAHNFISRVVNGGSTSIARRMYQSMMDATRSKIVLLTGTPIINHPFELGMLLNLARGPMPVHSIHVTPKARSKGKGDAGTSAVGNGDLTKDAVNALIEHDDVAPVIDQWMFSETDQTLQVSLLPQGYTNTLDWKGRTVVEKKNQKQKHGKEKVEAGVGAADSIRSIVKQLSKAGFDAKAKVIEMYAFPSKKEDFVAHFIDESDVENPRVKNIDLFSRRLMGLVSYYRSAGEEYFPSVSPAVIEATELCDTQFNTYVQARDKERRMESSQKRGRGRGGILGAKATVYRAFSRMACNFAFPKEIPRVFPNDIRHALRREIDVVDEDEEKQATADVPEPETGKRETNDMAGGAGCSKYRKAECIASPDCEWIPTKGCKAKAKQAPAPVPAANAAATAAAAKVSVDAAKANNNKDIERKYELAVDQAMAKLESNADKYLSLDALRNNYSSKFAKVYYHIDTSPGKVLLYSQFRSVEGIGLMRLILQHQGYAEVRLETNKKEWQIANGDEVLAPEYDGKRFIVFDGDRAKTQLMLQIFNGMYAVLPQSLQQQLARFDVGKSTANLHGGIVKLLMITQSGAEGISLKCVRRVLITEPFWNQVRMDQVIGRAVRTGSHLDLPPEERTVQVYIYTSVFTKKQLEENFTLRRLDHSQTSDSHILQTAQKKDALTQVFMNALKTSAIDCRNNAAANKPTSQGLSCYAFPISTDPNEYANTPSLDYDASKDSSYKNKLIRSKKIRGHVVSLPASTTTASAAAGERVKYVRVDSYPDKLFDYNAYKSAGVLVEVSLA